MAYSAVPEQTTGDTWTASDHNTYIRDNFAAGVPDIFTTAGDIVYATAANTGARLGIGTAYQVLQTNSGATAPEWAEAMGCLVYYNTNYSIPNDSATAIPWNAEARDTNTFHSLVASQSRITIPITGIYRVYAQVLWEGNADGIRRMQLYKSTGGGPATSIARSEKGCPAAIQEYQNISITLSLTAADYLQIYVYQSSGGALNVESAGYVPFFGVDWIR